MMEVVDSKTSAFAPEKVDRKDKEAYIYVDSEAPEVDTTELGLKEIAELRSDSTSEATADTREAREVDTVGTVSVEADIEGLAVGKEEPVTKAYLVLPVAVVVVSELYELV